jgi:hypothetical protein
MADKNFTALAIGGALIAGAAIGAAIGSRSSHEIAAVAQRVDAIEARVAEQVETAAGELQQLVAAAAPGDALGAIESRATALEARIAEVAAQAASGDATKAVEDRVTVLAQQMAALIGRMNDIAAGVAAPAPADGAADAPAAAAAPAAAGEAPAAPDAAALEALLGENGAAVSVGQTGIFGEDRVFLSRVDAASGDVLVQVVGKGSARFGATAGSLTLPGGCVLTLVGVAGNRAFIDAACAN